MSRQKPCTNRANDDAPPFMANPQPVCESRIGKLQIGSDEVWQFATRWCTTCGYENVSIFPIAEGNGHCSTKGNQVVTTRYVTD